MCIGETAVPLRGQALKAFRATDLTRLVVKGDETLGMQLGKVLTDADHGDAKDARQYGPERHEAPAHHVEATQAGDRPFAIAHKPLCYRQEDL
jgi:hypothetical protein